MIGGSTSLNLLFVTWLVARSHLAYSQAPRAELLRDTIALARAAQLPSRGNSACWIQRNACGVGSFGECTVGTSLALSLMIDVLDLLQFSQSAD